MQIISNISIISCYKHAFLFSVSNIALKVNDHNKTITNMSHIMAKCADAQAGLDSCWSQTHDVGFVMARLICLTNVFAIKWVKTNALLFLQKVGAVIKQT
jgi:hypothetical protein